MKSNDTTPQNVDQKKEKDYNMIFESSHIDMIQQKEGDWIVPAQEDKSTKEKLIDFKLNFVSIDIHKENFLQIVYYQFNGSFEIQISIDNDDIVSDTRVTRYI